MMKRFVPVVAVLGSILLAVSGPTQAQENASLTWPQFRGPGGLGLAPDNQPLLAEFGPEKNVVWKTALSVGHSSPCIWENRIFLTGYDRDNKKLETICLDRKTGKISWKHSVSPQKIENTHKVSTPAAPTPATDGERVYVYFGSFGLICYDLDGVLQWQRELAIPHARFGTGSSPIVAGGLVILSCDHTPTPYLLAVDGKTGETVWKKERVPAFEGYATPFLWRHDGGEELILHTSPRIVSYAVPDGAELWWVPHKSTACTTPVAGGGKLFVANWAHGGEEDDLVPLPTFAEMLKRYDKDKDGKISQPEFPQDMYVLKRKGAENVPNADIKLVWYFKQIDKNKDGKIDESEWAVVHQSAEMKSEHGLVAIRPGGKNDASKTHQAWKHKQSIPEVSSPLYYQGLVYLVREGGIVTCLDAATGKVQYKQRLGATGAYFSSPVAGDGKIYACSYDGVVSVLAAGKKFEILAQNDLGDNIMATPALLDGRVYLRTEKHLYAFGN